MEKRETILYFGSFNPIHNGHTTIARYVIEKGFCEELWFVVSPQNPLKSENILAGELDRLRMAEIAVSEKLAGLDAKVSDVEFGLPRPSFTIDTLKYLEANYPNNSFSLLMGTDIIPQLPRWKEYEKIVENYNLYVYPRKGFTLTEMPYRAVYMKDAPLFEFSSTDIRQTLMDGNDISNMVSAKVMDYIIDNNLWTRKNSK